MTVEVWYFRISMCVFLFIAKKIWNVLYIFWLGPALIKVDVRSYGKWAMVTGSTDGIGKEYARQLAARGCDIILVSRSLDKLKNVANEIETEFKVQTKIIQIDFTGDLSIYDKLEGEIKGLEVGTLVNNVGTSYTYPEYFLELPDWTQFTTNLINVNIVSIIRVTRLVLPDMVKRGKGIIINIGSTSNHITSPLTMVYAATKAFDEKFSDGLRSEYGSKGIIVQCVSPGYVATNMTKLSSNFLVATPKNYVKSALRMVGSVHCSSGYFIHSCFILFFNFLEFISEDFCAFVVRKFMEFAQMVHYKRYGTNKPNTK